MIRLFKNLQIIRIFQKKILFFTKNLGGSGSSSGSTTGSVDVC